MMASGNLKMKVEFTKEAKQWLDDFKETCRKYAERPIQVNAKDGCVIVLRYAGSVSAELAECFKDQAKETFPFASKVLVLTDGMELTVIDPEEDAE